MSSHTFPLTLCQAAIYLDQVRRPGNPIYNVGGYIRMGHVDLARMAEAHRRLVVTDDIFGLRIGVGGSGVRQEITEARTHHLPLVDVSATADPTAAAQAWLEDLFRTPIPIEDGELYRAFLVRLAPNCHWYVGVAHHVMMDGWGFGNWAKNVCVLYGGGQIENGHSWRSVIDRDQHYLNSVQFESDREFWADHLRGTKHILEARHRDEFKESLRVPSERTVRNIPVADIATIASELGCGVSTLILASFCIYLSVAYREPKLSIGLTLHNRWGRLQKAMLGAFVNIVPLRLAIDVEASGRSLCADISRELRRIMRHSRYPVGHVDSRSKGAATEDRRLFDVCFNFLDLDTSPFDSGQGTDLVYVPNGHSATPLALTAWRGHAGQSFELQFDYNLAYFSAIEAETLVDGVLYVLRQLCKDPDRNLGAIRVMTDAERLSLLIDALGKEENARAGANDVCLHQLIEGQARITPHAPALVFPEGILSYLELDGQAQRMASVLRKQGVGRGDLVGICLPRSHWLVVTQLAVLKCAAAYVPIDADYPPERIAYMLDDAKPRVVISQGEASRRIQATGRASILELQDMVGASTAEARDGEMGGDATSSPTDLAYVIYTSGSTGEPKGVMVEHQSVVNLVRSWPGSGLIEGMHASAWTSVGFDVWAFEVYVPLANGATLHVVPEAVRLDNDALVDWMEKRKIAHAYLPPHVIRAMNDLPDERISRLALRWLLVGVEPLIEGDLYRLERLIPGLRIINGYGPTEATVFCTSYGAMTDRRRNAPIGKPINHARVYVVNEDMKLVPRGAPGELCIGGVPVARGYLNKPELSAASFMTDPFAEIPDVRLYRTGDIVRWLPDGNLGFIGRRDSQVKLRGYRIELEEVEAVLRRLDGVVHAAVTVSSDGSDLLVAHMAGGRGTETPDARRVAAWRSEMASRLPAHMVPGRLLWLDALPVTSNGKLDRASLASAGGLRIDGVPYVAPRNAMEKELCDLWGETLGVDTVGIDDLFFGLGGHSLLALRMLSRVNATHHANVGYREFFMRNSVRELAEDIRASRLLQVLAPSEKQKTITI